MIDEKILGWDLQFGVDGSLVADRSNGVLGCVDSTKSCILCIGDGADTQFEREQIAIWRVSPHPIQHII